MPEQGRKKKTRLICSDGLMIFSVIHISPVTRPGKDTDDDDVKFISFKIVTKVVILFNIPN